MPTSSRVLLLAPLLSACVEIKIDFPCAGAGCPDTGDEPADSGAASDSWEPLKDLSECETELPSELTLPIDADCGATPVEDWELVEVWMSSDYGSFSMNASAGRALDGDEDGAITAADPMQIWMMGMDYIELFDAAGAELGTVKDDTDHPEIGAETYDVLRIDSDLADVDPGTPGVELMAVWSYWRRGGARAAVFNGANELWLSSIEEGNINHPTLTDLEADGVLEAVVGNWIVDAATGAHLGWLEGLEGVLPEDMRPAITVDLDLDGHREIIVAALEAPASKFLGVYESDGTLRGTCVEGFEDTQRLTYGAGNLDDDPEGEVFVAGATFHAICDADGTLLASASTDTEGVAMVGIGQLDEDPEAELVVAGGYGLVVLELDLTEKWHITGENFSYSPFALADLNGDGRHEVIYLSNSELVIVGPDGEELARDAVGWSRISSQGASLNQPIVADVDADGLAEIVATTGGRVEVIENASGGWPVRDAATPWHGLNRAPHDRDVAGAIPAPAATWLEEGYNVWQGLPAGAPGRPDLSVSFVDVCGDSCDEDVTVVVQAGNTGTVPLFGGAELVLYAADGAELGRTTLSGTLRPGEGRYASFTVPASALDAGLRAEVTATDATDECGRADNTAVWTEDPCP